MLDSKTYLSMSSHNTFAEILHREHADNFACGVTHEQVANISWQNLWFDNIAISNDEKLSANGNKNVWWRMIYAVVTIVSCISKRGHYWRQRILTVVEFNAYAALSSKIAVHITFFMHWSTLSSSLTVTRLASPCVQIWITGVLLDALPSRATLVK